jgi:uncharacterized membrane protein
MPELIEWNSFYVIVGSSAGALIGLQFVVLTLVAERPHAQMGEASAAFATPSVVHFGVVLLLSAVMSAPWQGFGPVMFLWALVGLSGIIYGVVVIRRMQAQKVYKPVLEDWLFYGLLPLIPYAMLAVAFFVTRAGPRRALFVVAAATLMFLFLGIRNSWDAITYHVVSKGRQQKRASNDRD